jgi:hypothetical protein
MCQLLPNERMESPIPGIISERDALIENLKIQVEKDRNSNKQIME